MSRCSFWAETAFHEDMEAGAVEVMYFSVVVVTVTVCFLLNVASFVSISFVAVGIQALLRLHGLALQHVTFSERRNTWCCFFGGKTASDSQSNILLHCLAKKKNIAFVGFAKTSVEQNWNVSEAME